MSIGAISSILGSNAALDNYNTIKTGVAGGVPTAATEAQASGAKTSSGASSDDPSGTGLSAIVAAVQTFMSDYQNVYGGQAVEAPAQSFVAGLDMAHLTSALRTMSEDFAQFFGPALGTDVQPFGLPLSSTQSLADVQAAMADRSAVQSSGSAGQTAAPVVQPTNAAGQAAMAATGIRQAAVTNYAAVAIREPPSGAPPGLVPAKGRGGST